MNGRRGWFWITWLSWMLIACSTQLVHRGSPLPAGDRWVLLPVVNHSDTPQAGERIEAILGTLLRAAGLPHLSLYPTPEEPATLTELDDRRRLDKAFAWARAEGFHYAVTGTVEEWRYKSGLDGEPAVGVSLMVLALPDGQVVWSASGAKSGWGRESVSGTAQQLLSKLLEELPLVQSTPANHP